MEKTRNKALETFIQLYSLFAPESKLNTKNKLTLYKQYILPIMLYRATTWGLAAETHIKQLERLQNRILRKCTDAPWLIRNTTIRRDLEMPTITEHINIQKEALIQDTTNHINPLVSREFSYENDSNQGTYKKTKIRRNIR